jgi:hypothetical protein
MWLPERTGRTEAVTLLQQHFTSHNDVVTSWHRKLLMICLLAAEFYLILSPDRLKWLSPSSGILETTTHNVQSSGMLRRVDIVCTNVSEEHIASIFRAEISTSEELAWAGGPPQILHGSISVRRWRGVTPTQLGSLERANLISLEKPWQINYNYLIAWDQAPHLRTETNPVSETLCFLVSRIPDDVKSPKKPSNSEWYTPSSEPFRIYWSFIKPEIAELHWSSLSTRSNFA